MIPPDQGVCTVRTSMIIALAIDVRTDQLHVVPCLENIFMYDACRHQGSMRSFNNNANSE